MVHIKFLVVLEFTLRDICEILGIKGYYYENDRDVEFDMVNLLRIKIVENILSILIEINLIVMQNDIHRKQVDEEKCKD